MTLISSIVIVTLLANLCHTAPLDKGNSVFARVINAAIHEMLSDDTGDLGFVKINDKWFGGPSVVRKPIEECDNTAWPELSEIKEGTLLHEILYSSHQILFGSGIPNVPKRYNFTAVGQRNNITFGTTVGFESDIGNSIAARISSHYQLSTPINAYWVPSAWLASSTNNIVYNLFAGQFDMILAGMSTLGTWQDPLNPGLTKDRTQILTFTCAYQDDGEAAVRGTRPLEGALVEPTSVQTLNQAGLIVCVHSGTAMATWARANLPLSNVVEYVHGPDVKNATVNGDCHVYLAPIINAAWDAETTPGFSLAVTYYPENKPLAIGLRKDTPDDDSSVGSKLSTSLLFSLLFFALSLLWQS